MGHKGRVRSKNPCVPIFSLLSDRDMRFLPFNTEHKSATQSQDNIVNSFRERENNFRSMTCDDGKSATATEQTRLFVLYR